MANNTILLGALDGTLLTSQIYAVGAAVSKSKVSVQVTRDPDGDADMFFTTTLYSYEGHVELAEIGALIEQRFRTKNRIYDTIRISIDGESADFTAIYCEYDLEADFDCKSAFLCAAGSSVVHRTSTVWLAHIPAGSSQYRVQIVGHDTNGTIKAVEKIFTKSQYQNQVSFTVAEILDFAVKNTAHELDDPLADVSYFAISYGPMQKVCYLVPHPQYITFGYRNIFNAYETVDVVGTVTRKTAYDSSEAVSAGVTCQYDRTVLRTYDVQTGSLTADQVRELEQLIGSHAVELRGSQESYPVIITDHTVEIDNDDETLASIKFTFRFAGRRPRLVDDDMGALMPHTGAIFSKQFTPEFT